MARPLRIEYAGAWYHVMNRGGAYRTIFLLSEHRHLFLELLEEIHQRYDVEIHAYCLMDNHYHLLVRTPKANLGRAMRHLNGIYTQRFNRLENSDGALFRGRYKAILIEENPYFLQVSRYIHRNPIEAKLVKTCMEYSWSSFRFFVTPTKELSDPIPSFLNVNFTLKTIANKNQRKLYADFVEQSNSEDMIQFYDGKKQSPILGSDSFKEQFKKDHTVMDMEIPDQKLFKTPISLERIVDGVADFYGVSPEGLLHSKRAVLNEPRKVGIYLARQLEDFSLKTVSTHFGIKHYSRVSKITSDIQQRLQEDAALNKAVLKIIKIIKSKT